MTNAERLRSVGRLRAGVAALLVGLSFPFAAWGGLFDDATPPARQGAAATPATPTKSAGPIPQPIPNSFQIGGVEKLLRQVYGAALDGKSPEEADAMARKLLDECGQSDDPAEQWVLLREARERAARAGDAALALDAIAAAVERFDFDPQEMIRATLGTLAASDHPMRQAAGDELQFARRCFVSGQFALAARAMETAQAVARGCRDQSFPFQAAALQSQIDAALDASRKASAAAEALASRPRDGTSYEQIGRFDCFTLGRWPAGLAMLSKAGNEPLQTLAMKELGNNATPDSHLALAEQWLVASKTERENPDAFRRRAEYWYRRAIDQLDGLPRLSAEKRLRQIATEHLERGVVCELFNGRSLARRLLTRIEPQVNFPWNGRPPASGVPAECFSARLTAWIKCPGSGEYKIDLRHDDGARLWIDGNLVIDNWTLGAREDAAGVSLSTGYHDLRIELMQGEGQSQLVMLWLPPGERQLVPVPPEVLFHEPLDTAGQLQTAIEPAADGTIYLPAVMADVHGQGCRYYDIDGSAPAVAGLENPGAYASWDVQLAAGMYRVDITTCCDANSGGEFLVTVGPAGLRGTSQNTGGWDHPATQPLGAVKLSAGWHRITVRSISSPHSRACRVNEITLRPKK